MSRLQKLARNRSAAIGFAIVAVLVAASIFAPLLDVHNPLSKNMAGLSALGAPLPPSAEYPFGTDMLGRCVASRLLYGGRVSLEIAAAATLLALTVGLAVGLIAGYAGRLTDTLLMRLTDLVLAFPFMLLVIALTVVFRESGAGLGAVLLALGLIGWTQAARVIRGKVLTVREMEFIQAARAVGAGPTRILLRHVLPSVTGAILVLASLSAGQMILAESTLSYLGLGTPPPNPTWGRMLSEGQSYLRGAPWLVFAPGLAVFLAVLGFNLLGEGLRETLDHKVRR